MIELSLDLNKCNKSFQNRIVVRQGDVGEKILISIYDNKKPAALTEQHKVKLEGNLKNGDYVESEANLYNSEKGKYVFQFQSKDVSIIGEYQRAFLRIYDENDNRVSSEEVHIEVLKDADISQSQATTYVSQLDNVLENMDKEFDSFMDEKEVDYEKLDEKCDEIGTELIYIQNESKGIKKTQSDILQSIKDNELTTKTELEIENQKSSANVIYQLIGKEKVQMTF
ncbi:MAG: BppU family phage baseplate upper protein, partial [Enterococcus devriesei]|uniref:BppU family phage baseplate upper protein n=1 Tax=Enterococcus devriesei TaxID=319970 RepID=UPI003F917662